MDVKIKDIKVFLTEPDNIRLVTVKINTTILSCVIR